MAKIVVQYILNSEVPKFMSYASKYTGILSITWINSDKGMD